MRHIPTLPPNDLCFSNFHSTEYSLFSARTSLYNYDTLYSYLCFLTSRHRAPPQFQLQLRQQLGFFSSLLLLFFNFFSNPPASLSFPPQPQTHAQSVIVLPTLRSTSPPPTSPHYIPYPRFSEHIFYSRCLSFSILSSPPLRSALYTSSTLYRSLTYS